MGKVFPQKGTSFFIRKKYTDKRSSKYAPVSIRVISYHSEKVALEMAPRTGTVLHWLILAGSSTLARKYFCDKGGVIRRGSKREG
jgi:hypothetical protein